MPGLRADVPHVDQPSVPARLLGRKMTTAARVFRGGGTRALVEVLGFKAARAFGWRRAKRAFQVWCEREHWWAGLLVACTGNVVQVDSCTFLVSHPAIRTASKSLLLLGGYERAERELLGRYLDRSGAVIELGGSIGVVACVTNRMLRNPRRHVVVEANPDLISTLVANRNRNGCEFAVLNRALAYGEPSTTFYVDSRDFLASSVQVKSDRAIQVPTVTLEEIIDEYGFETCSLVCDVEGAEMEMVRHEPQALQDHVALLIVEIHGWRVGQDRGAQTIQRLQQIGFHCLHEKDGTYVFRNQRLDTGTERTLAR